MLAAAAVSPFSTSYKWRVQISGENPEPSLFLTEKEQKVLHALREVDVIGANQLTRIFFSGDKKKAKKMVYKGILIQHSLWNESKEIPFYSLSPCLIRQTGGMEPMSLSVREILSRLVFFQLYGRVKELFPVTIHRSNRRPFLGILVREDGTRFHVGILRGNLHEWEYFLKWSVSDERIILVVEQLPFLKPLESLLQGKMIRVTTDLDLKNTPIEQLFYKWDGDQWKREKA
ncbi:hypothetical protein [Brevibacillus marinus]|uniref:hypothetical protein n=1 Tax=Brevibacillus marinus TaxID=2496837 RepID=UPI000F84C6A7|nr:hypothetical protein [Brevibacillus marinus]